MYICIYTYKTLTPRKERQKRPTIEAKETYYLLTPRKKRQKWFASVLASLCFSSRRLPAP